jgi:hypothetical protein
MQILKSREAKWIQFLNKNSISIIYDKIFIYRLLQNQDKGKFDFVKQRGMSF